MTDDTSEVLRPFRDAVLTDLSDEDLASVLLSYPACCVAIADGHFDEAERLFMLEVCERLGDQDPSDPSGRLATAERFACLVQLVARRSELDSLILGALRAECSRDPDTREQILAMLEGAAEASGGTSDTERTEIARIRAALGA